MKRLSLQLPRATVGVSRWRRFRAAIDWPLILTVLALCTIGLLNLYSATRGVRQASKFEAQMQWMVVEKPEFIENPDDPTKKILLVHAAAILDDLFP